VLPLYIARRQLHHRLCDRKRRDLLRWALRRCDDSEPEPHGHDVVADAGDRHPGARSARPILTASVEGLRGMNVATRRKVPLIVRPDVVEWLVPVVAARAVIVRALLTTSV